MISIDDDVLKIFRDSVGLFAIVDYNTPKGPAVAQGKLVSVSLNGNVFIRHLNDPQTSWGFNIEDVENYKFSPIRARGDSDGSQ